MFTRIRHTICSPIVIALDMHPVEVSSLLAALCWAVSLACPGDTFRSPDYTYLVLLGSEGAWSAMMAVLAVAHTSVLFFYKKPGFVRMGVLFWAMSCWSYIAYSFILLYPPSPGGWTHAVLALMVSWTFIRCGERTSRGLSRSERPGNVDPRGRRCGRHLEVHPHDPW